MKTAEQILENTNSFLDDTMGRCYERIEVLSAMNEYALQFMNLTKCFNCEGSGVVLNNTCINCNGQGKIILLPINRNDNYQ